MNLPSTFGMQVLSSATHKSLQKSAHSNINVCHALFACHMLRTSVNIVVLGPSGSGKSSLVQCFVNDSACTPQTVPPSIIPSRTKTIIWEARRVICPAVAFPPLPFPTPPSQTAFKYNALSVPPLLTSAPAATVLTSNFRSCTHFPRSLILP